MLVYATASVARDLQHAGSHPHHRLRPWLQVHFAVARVCSTEVTLRHHTNQSRSGCRWLSLRCFLKQMRPPTTVLEPLPPLIASPLAEPHL
jgi:hypothetical protein